MIKSFLDDAKGIRSKEPRLQQNKLELAGVRENRPAEEKNRRFEMEKERIDIAKILRSKLTGNAKNCLLTRCHKL